MTDLARATDAALHLHSGDTTVQPTLATPKTHSLEASGAVATRRYLQTARSDATRRAYASD